MKRLVLPIVIALALMLAASPVLAGSVVSRFSFKGQSADAFFDSTDGSGCVVTFVGVFANDGQVKMSGSPRTLSSVAAVSIDVFDTCTATSILSAFGFTELAADEFTLSPLSTASLTTSIEVFDFVSATSFVVDISLDWTGVGDTFRQKGNFKFTTPGFRFSDHFDGTFREATAAGTVSDGTTNFTPDPSIFGSLADVKSASKVVEKL